MDRRLMERRQRVAEERARSNLSRLVRLLAVLAALAGAVWFAQSPFLSVDRIAVSGADRVDPSPVLEDHGVTQGRPLLLLDVSGAEQSLLEDPWVETARVAREWPTSVVVEIEERTPAAVAELADGPWLVAADATLLESPSEPRPDLPVVRLSDLAEEEAGDSLELAGAVEYVTALPEPYRADAVVNRGEEGLEATVAGYPVRVGRPFDATEKARVTAAMLEEDLEEGTVLTVVAPASPAILPPDATVPPDTTTTTTP